MKKIEMAQQLKDLINNIDENKIISSYDKLYFTANRWKIENLSNEELAKRTTKEGIQQLIYLFKNFQLGGK
jgi:hypothetical protein